MKIPADKIGHALAGAAVGIALTAISLVVGILPLQAGLIGAFVAIWVGVGKEMADSYRPDIHTEDSWDAMATGLGGFIGAALTALAFYLLT